MKNIIAHTRIDGSIQHIDLSYMENIIVHTTQRLIHTTYRLQETQCGAGNVQLADLQIVWRSYSTTWFCLPLRTCGSPSCFPTRPFSVMVARFLIRNKNKHFIN